MKSKIDPVEVILAIFVTAFLFLCMVVVNDSGAVNRPQYNPPCSMEHQLTILEELKCEQQNS